MFFWQKWTKRKPVKRRAPVRATITETQRQSYRASVEFPVVYAVEGRTGSRTAVANDLSAGGLRLIGDEDLPNETVVELRFTLPNDLIQSVHVEKEIFTNTPRGKTKRKVMVPPDPFRPMSVHAKSVIAFLNLHRRKLAHGLQFVDIDERTQEEIQRFIHVWQIRQLRERAHMRGE
ncbi:MAG: PilZ domain-containing protein [Candidatus Eremiobacteraeota bacterium]|nr:PilZ domain-containing protein [Candidatus Eremiobacteraeota bacterium]MBV8369824.1 PilZ domain-containing protein [Candidatus Eremiobacteraeota bacterium]